MIDPVRITRAVAESATALKLLAAEIARTQDFATRLRLNEIFKASLASRGHLLMSGVASMENVTAESVALAEMVAVEGMGR